MKRDRIAVICFHFNEQIYMNSYEIVKSMNDNALNKR